MACRSIGVRSGGESDHQRDFHRCRGFGECGPEREICPLEFDGQVARPVCEVSGGHETQLSVADTFREEADYGVHGRISV